MKCKLYVPIAGMALLLSLNCVAAHAQDSSPAATADSAQPQKTIQMVPVRASLNKGLDAKKAKQGDPVTAKLQEDMKTADTTLPKNTVLMGHVDQVQPSENKGDSTIQVTFDKAQIKGGQEVPVKATIMQIAPPPSNMAMAMNGAGASPSASSAPAAAPAPAPSGGSSASGGGGGAAMQQSAPSAASTTPMPNDSQQQPSGQPGISGVTLKSDIHDSNSGTFTSKGKNVHLSDGTQLALAVAVIPPNMQMK